MSGPAVAIGYILLIPSILGIVACVILLIIIAVVPNDAATDVLVAALGTGIVVAIGVGCFVSGLLGWLLVMKKDVLQCDNCGAVVNASMNPHPGGSMGSAEKFGLCFLAIVGASIAIGAIWMLIPKAGLYEAATTSISVPTATTEEPPPNPIFSTTLPSPHNPTEPAQSDTMQPFISADGRFSVLFPGTPHQASQPVRQTTGETTTYYDFVAVDGSGNTGYIVVYTDDPDFPSPQVQLPRSEKLFVAGKTLLSDQVIDLHGVPGRAYTATDSKYNYTVHEFRAGTRSYRLLVSTRKGYTATQADQFMNSFKIWGNPPTDEHTAPALTAQPVPDNSSAPEPSAPATGTQATNSSPSDWLGNPIQKSQPAPKPTAQPAPGNSSASAPSSDGTADEPSRLPTVPGTIVVPLGAEVCPTLETVHLFDNALANLTANILSLPINQVVQQSQPGYATRREVEAGYAAGCITVPSDSRIDLLSTIENPDNQTTPGVFGPLYKVQIEGGRGGFMPFLPEFYSQPGPQSPSR